MILERIRKENDIQELKWDELNTLATEIREFLIEHVSNTGGHLASNLGTVELTMALHLSLSLPKDKIIWDVGHQAYTHKILTGRKEGFSSLRQYQGMSGFPKRSESACDSFDTGHSSTSISAGLGYVNAREILKEDYSVVSVIGDGSLTGGMAFEALNNSADLKSNYMIVLNDNKMSISENVGGMSLYLDKLRTADFYNNLKIGVTNVLEKIPGVGKKLVASVRKTKNSIKQLFVPGMFFEDMGITYLGPVDGHDLKVLYKTFQEAKRVQGPVLVHVLTTKGKGYAPAEENPAKYHGVSPFNVNTGETKGQKAQETYTDAFSQILCELGEEEPRLVAITAAMKSGTGLTKFQEKFPDRFFDVGIAEEHAVTFAGGLATAGMKPVFAVYSSFLQRAYDQIVHDICMQKLPVIFAIDRAGLVGNDGETHQGVFDVSYLSHIPNMTILAPKNQWEFKEMMRFAVQYDGPIAIRYPRGNVYDGLKNFQAPVVLGKSEMLYEESDIAIFAVGHMMETAENAYRILKEKGYTCSLVNSRFIKPLDTDMVRHIARNHKLIVTVEENLISGSYGAAVTQFVATENLSSYVLVQGIQDCYVEHGDIAQLRKNIGLDVESIVESIESEWKRLAE